MKTIILRKDQLIDYQTLIEEVVGIELSKINCYDGNWDRKTEINGEKVERDRAYFVPDADYEMIIVKKRETK